MNRKVPAVEVVNLLKQHSGTNNVPLIEISNPESVGKDLIVHEITAETSLDEYFSFCKSISVDFFSFWKFVLEKSDLEAIKADDDEGEEEDDEEEFGLTPKAEKIIIESIEKQVTLLMAKVGQIGSVLVFGQKGKNLFRYEVADDWYELYVKLSDVYDNLEENGPEILSSDEIVKFNHEMGIRESRESIMRRREAELAVKKDEFFNLLSKDSIFLNAKNISLRMARIEKLIPENLDGFITKREAVDGGVNGIKQTIEKMSSGGMSKEDIAKELGVREAVLKKYLDLG